jgi:hypothetical protein
MLFIFSTIVLIRYLWQLKTVVFLHWCLICAILLSENGVSLCWFPFYYADCHDAQCHFTECLCANNFAKKSGNSSTYTQWKWLLSDGQVGTLWYNALISFHFYVLYELLLLLLILSKVYRKILISYWLVQNFIILDAAMPKDEKANIAVTYCQLYCTK